MSDIVNLDEHRPHISGPVVCTRCRHKWVAVRPVGVDLLECPACGASRGASLDTMLHKPHIILGEGCCGQRDASGTCMAPACIFGEALKMAQEAADRIEQLEAEAKTRTLDYLGQVGQLYEELERLRAALRQAIQELEEHGDPLATDIVKRICAALEGK